MITTTSACLQPVHGKKLPPIVLTSPIQNLQQWRDRKFKKRWQSEICFMDYPSYITISSADIMFWLAPGWTVHRQGYQMIKCTVFLETNKNYTGHPLGITQKPARNDHDRSTMGEKKLYPITLN